MSLKYWTVYRRYEAGLLVAEFYVKDGDRHDRAWSLVNQDRGEQ